MRSVPQQILLCGLIFLVNYLVLARTVTAASFDCHKAASTVEKLICEKNGFLSDLDDDLSIAYQWTLIRAESKQKVIETQRHWLTTVRNVCQDKECLAKAYFARIDELTIQAEKPGCYVLQPIKDTDGKKVRPVEPVCHVLEKNLNRFCDQPPVACGLKIYPEFRHQLTLLAWKAIDAQENLALMEAFLRAQWVDVTSVSQQKKDALWESKRQKIELALAEKRLSFSTARLDLYNLGEPKLYYRLDYGDCEASNPQFMNRERWGYAISAAPVQIQAAPEITRKFFKQYFPLERSPVGEVFLYGGKTYLFWMYGKSNPSEEGPPADNWLMIDRLGEKVYAGDTRLTLFRTNICHFSYQPIPEGSK